MGRKKKFEEGTAGAFRLKKDFSKITIEDAEAIMQELDKSYQEYREKWQNADSKELKDAVEQEYLKENETDIKRIKDVARDYTELIPGVRGVISDVFFNMKYTQMRDKRQIMELAKQKGQAKLEKQKKQTKRRKTKK